MRGFVWGRRVHAVVRLRPTLAAPRDSLPASPEILTREKQKCRRGRHSMRYQEDWSYSRDSPPLIRIPQGNPVGRELKKREGAEREVDIAEYRRRKHRIREQGFHQGVTAVPGSGRDEPH